MKLNKTFLFQSVLISFLAIGFAACTEDNDASDDDAVKCTADICSEDGKNLLVCDKATGKTTEKTCPNGCKDGKCTDDPSGDKCTADKCKDDKILLVCDRDSGNTTEKTCPNGCKDDKCADAPSGDKCTADKCKDDKILLVCDRDSGNTTEKTCPNGCKDDKCADAPSGDKCTADKCKDETTLSVCNKETGTAEDKKCDAGCKDDKCLPKCTADACSADGKSLILCDLNTGKTSEKACSLECKDNRCIDKCTADICSADGKSLLTCDKTSGRATAKECPNGCLDGKCLDTAIEINCKASAKPTCADSNTLLFCDDIFGDGNVKSYKKHCSNGRVCRMTDGVGACTADVSAVCRVNSCKDIHTLNVCSGGVETPVKCGDDELCINDMCIARKNIKTCTKDADCGTDICLSNICYPKTTKDINEGDPCDSKSFTEFCRDGKIYQCGYGTPTKVETTDCADSNGCAVILEARENKDTLTVNAVCRGTDDQLKECSKPGPIGYTCENNKELSVHTSHGDVCLTSTDGKAVHAHLYRQYECGENKCDDSTGFCPGSTETCPTGDIACQPRETLLGSKCDADNVSSVCNGAVSVLTCNNVWQETICPDGLVCSVNENGDSVCSAK